MYQGQKELTMVASQRDDRVRKDQLARQDDGHGQGVVVAWVL